MSNYRLSNIEKKEIKKVLHQNLASEIDGSELCNPTDGDWDDWDERLEARQKYAHEVNDRICPNPD